MADYSDLTRGRIAGVDCVVLDSVPSTNDYLSARPFSLKPQACIARAQTRGKGQYQRRWLSQKNGSILLSIRRVFAAKLSLNGLSLVVGLAIIDTLNRYGADNLQLKWPNDVYFENKKLAGILIENSVKTPYQSAVIGLGLNVDLSDDFVCEAPWIDLKTITKKSVHQPDLCRDLIETILDYATIFAEQGFSGFYETWQTVDYLRGKHVDYADKTRVFSGICLGVNRQGVLLVGSGTKIEPIYSSGFLRFCPPASLG